MFHFPDSDTGYYDTEEAYYAHDRELEVAAQNRDDRFVSEAEEMQARLWEGQGVLDHAPGQPIDPETGCTKAEMKEDESARLRSFPRRLVARKVAAMCPKGEVA